MKCKKCGFPLTKVKMGTFDFKKGIKLTGEIKWLHLVTSDCRLDVGDVDE